MSPADLCGLLLEWNNKTVHHLVHLFRSIVLSELPFCQLPETGWHGAIHNLESIPCVEFDNFSTIEALTSNLGWPCAVTIIHTYEVIACDIEISNCSYLFRICIHQNHSHFLCINVCSKSTCLFGQVVGAAAGGYLQCFWHCQHLFTCVSESMFILNHQTKHLATSLILKRTRNVNRNPLISPSSRLHRLIRSKRCHKTTLPLSPHPLDSL